jgi:NTE family protein
MAVRAETVAPNERGAVIAARLPSHGWPDTQLAVAAIDASTGELRWLDVTSGATLVEAVGASCAVPGVWPCVEIDGRPHYDGGVPSPDNAEGARGCGSVLLVSPMGSDRTGALTRRVKAEVEALESGGTRVTVVVPDPTSRGAIGRQSLDPAGRPKAARAGLEQGRRIASEVVAGWP